MMLPKLKPALIICTVFFPVSASLERSPVYHLSADPQSEGHYEQQRDVTKSFAGAEGEELVAKALDTLPLTRGELHGRSLVRSAAAKNNAGNSTGAAERLLMQKENMTYDKIIAGNSTSLRPASVHLVWLRALKNRTSYVPRTGGISPTGAYYTYLTCGCFTGDVLGKSRICTGSSSTSSCSSYSLAPYVAATVPTGKAYYFHCWCPSTSYLANRSPFDLVLFGNGGEKYCTYSKKTKSAFSMKCSFTLY
jgi:hypothetical protein